MTVPRLRRDCDCAKESSVGKCHTRTSPSVWDIPTHSQHYLMLKFQCLSCENFLTLVTKMPPMLKDMNTKKKWHPFSQKELNDLVRDLRLSKDSAELLASRLKEKTPLWQCSHQLLPPQASTVPPFFLYSERLGVLYRYCAASAQAWSATVRTQRFGSSSEIKSLKTQRTKWN